MDITKINLSSIKIKGKMINYNGNKFIISLPPLRCSNGIERYNNRYQIMLDLDIETNNELINAIKNIENYMAKKFTLEGYIFRSNIFHTSNKKCLIVKLPRRYDKFEFDIKSDKIYLPTSADIVKDTKLECEINIAFMWNLVSENSEKLAGYTITLKSVTIL